MTGLEEIQRAREAGFSDQEIEDHITSEKSKAQEAGFSPAEVDAYYGRPPFEDAPVRALLTENHKTATNPQGEGKTPSKPITNFVEALEAGLQMSVSGLIARGKAPDFAITEDTPRSSRIAANVTSLAGDVPAMVGGYLAGGGQITGTAGAFALPTAIRKVLMDKYEKGEVQGFSDFWDRFSGVALDTAKSWITGAATGAVGKLVGAADIPNKVLKGAAVTGSELATMVTVGNALEGQIPGREEFEDAAIALGFIKGSAAVAKKLRNLYAETGVTPEQVARDAEKDPTIQQDLGADNMDAPGRYKSPVSALQTIGMRISKDATEAKATTFQDVYTRLVDDLNPIREISKEIEKMTPEELRGNGEAPDTYKLMRLLRGSIGKAAHFLEIGTTDFNTLKTNGESLKAILQDQKDMEGFRQYLVAQRAVELHGRGVESGVDAEIAGKAVLEGNARFAELAKRTTDYQNRLVKYLKDSGIISDDAFEAMKEANKHYVPFFRVMDEQATGGLPRGSQVANPLKGIKGSERMIIDPLESIVKNTYAYVALAERNAANKKFIESAGKTTTPSQFFTKVPAPLKPVTLNEPEIRALFEAFVAERKTTEKKTQTLSETTRTEGGTTTTSGGGPETKPYTLNKARIREALLARGFATGEADQMIARLQSKEATSTTTGSTTVVEKLMKEVEKTSFIQELNIRLPNEAATVFRAMQIPLRPNEIAVFEKGKRNVYEVDPDVASAFKAMDAETANLFVKLIAIPAQTLRAGAILSPDFMVRNGLRDQIGAFVQSRNGYFPIFDFVRGAMSLVKRDEHFGNWLKAGGANAAMVSVDRQYLSQHLLQLSKETGLMEKAWNVVKSPIEVLRVASELIENSTRLGEFKRSTKGDGLTKGQLQNAAFGSREVTLDFARIGANMRAVNMISAFTNAQIQGVDRIIRAFGENPVGTTAKIGASVTLPSLLLWWANHDDERYKELPDWQKRLFWIVLTKDHIFRFPKPFEVGLIFGTLPEMAMEAYFTDNLDAFRDFEKALLDAFLPNLVPQIAQPVIEQFSNRSLFTGTPIVPHDVEKLLPEYQYNTYTTEAAKALGSIVGAFPGLRDRSIEDTNSLIGGTARALSTPVLMENYIRSWTGGLGMYALQLADKALREAGALPDPEKPTATLADIPVIKAFVVRYPSASAQSIQDFFNTYQAQQKYIDTFTAKAKDGDPAAVKIITEHADRMADLGAMKDTLSEHSNLIRLVYKNPDLTPDDKRQLIDTLYFRMIEVSRAGNDMFRELKKE